MNVVVVPARSGSKRIPGKNIRPFNGVPILQRVIETLKASEAFRRIVVSTDSQPIAELAAKAGAEVPFFRPAELADDFTDTLSVVVHAIETLLGSGPIPEHVFCVYPTSVFLRSAHIRQALEILETESVDYVATAKRVNAPYFRCFQCGPENKIEFMFPQYVNSRSQDLPGVLQDAAQLYAGPLKIWLERRPILGNRTRIIELPEAEAYDIDTETDWFIAEQLYNAMKH